MKEGHHVQARKHRHWTKCLHSRGASEGTRAPESQGRVLQGGHWHSPGDFNVSKGRIFGKAFGMPLVELVAIGLRSGKERSTMFAVPIVDSDRLVLVASLGDDDRHPAWHLNLQANPEVRATFAGSTRTMIARTAAEEERAERWTRITSVFEGYADATHLTDLCGDC